MKAAVGLISGLLLFSFYGCDYFCRDREINVAFVGFDSADVNNIVLRQYKTNSAFQNPVDTFLISRGDGRYIFTTINDTTILFRNSSSDDSAHITDGYDWAVFIPSNNRTIYISKIERIPGTGKHGCLNPIISFRQDSSTIAPAWVTTGKFWTEGYRAYIYK